MKKLRFPCLVLDHDDTIVNSTATIHYPAFAAFMKDRRPEIRFTLEEFFRLNFEPGVMPMYRDICRLNDQEIQEELDFWRAYVDTRIPEAYPGLKEILWDYKKRGGIICVSSHSFAEYIRRDYEANGLPQPELVYGWEQEPENRKPSPYAIYEIEKAFSLSPEEILVLDDLKPGFEMAREAGAAFAASGWANDVVEISSFMRQHCDYYMKTVEDFRALVAQ